ncbi:hypothetical protein [Novacetimonas hansenii]|uniref:hypothetical protein n=1 Tax=Novacetimonas hansenii TaxID=436 RepID=UPI0007982AF2|nr:hypothetical protein [Novacetimonas hansenii]WEQ57776.1 hypothetical protein LV563_07545 [Novacetimonas hansenii]CUW46309.1 hypothetical protein ATCC53582_00401 [Novacetimonas hansenii]
MQQPPLDPSVADSAPEASCLTGYDEQHLITYGEVAEATIAVSDRVSPYVAASGG